MKNEIEQAIYQAAGWMLAEACTLADKGEDIRTKEIPEMLDRMKRDLALHPDPVVVKE